MTAIEIILLATLLNSGGIFFLSCVVLSDRHRKRS